MRVVASAALVFSLVCTAAHAQQRNELEIYETREVDGCDPFTFSGQESFRLMNLLFAPLLEIDARGEVEYRLADRIDKAGRTWTIHLNRETSFAFCDPYNPGPPSYEAVRAKDVVRAYEVFCNAATDIREYTYSLQLKENLASVTALDDSTVQVKFKSDVDPREYYLSFPIAPAHRIPRGFVKRGIDAATGREDPFVFQPYGTGYYYVASRATGGRVWNLAKNRHVPPADTEHPYRDTAHIDFLTFRSQPNYESDINDFIIGNYDGPLFMPDVPPEKISDLQQNTRSHILYEMNAMRFSYIAFNIARAPFNDERVRQALSCAIDRNQLLGTLGGQGRPVTGPFPIDAPNYCESCPAAYQRFDQALAEHLLEQAGWIKQSSRWRVNSAGKQLRIRLTTVAEQRSIAAEVAERIMGFWENIGVKTDVEYLGAAEYKNRVRNQKDFDAAYGYWNFPSQKADPSSLFQTGGALNFISYRNAAVDTLFAIERRVRSDSALAVYHELHEQIANDAPYAFLFTINRRALGTRDLIIGPNIERWHMLRRINKWEVY